MVIEPSSPCSCTKHCSVFFLKDTYKVCPFASYYLKFLSDRRKTFFLSLGLSALAGYETSNRSEKLLPDGSTLLDKDCFIYGGALTLELETYLTDRVALLLNARERALFGSDIGKFHTQVSLGLKFIIN